MWNPEKINKAPGFSPFKSLVIVIVIIIVMKTMQPWYQDWSTGDRIYWIMLGFYK